MESNDRFFAEFDALASEIDQGVEGFRVNVKNIFNSQYLGKVFVGTYENETTKELTNKQGTVVFDTGSSWLTLTSDICSNCLRNAYSLNSRTFNLVNNTEFMQAYGSAVLYGF